MEADPAFAEPAAPPALEPSLWMAIASDGTVIIYPGTLRGGTEQTVRFCIELQRPHQLIDASKLSAEDAANLISDFVRKQNIGILNVAGPRQSEWPEGYNYASRTLDLFFRAAGL